MTLYQQLGACAHMKKILVSARTILVVILQSALLLLAMVLVFVPFSHAPSVLGLTSGYLTYLFYPLLLYLLLTFSHKWLNQLPITWLGFSWRSLPSRFALGFGIGVISVLGVVILTAVWQSEVSLELSWRGGSPRAVLILLADAWETSFMEEFLVRGYVLPALLRRKVGPHIAILWSVVLFTLAHFLLRPLWWLLPIAVTGLLLGYLYYATASIWTPVGCHFAGNLIFGLINRAIVLQAHGMNENLASLALTECAAYLALTALLMWWHRRQVKSGASDFPLPRILRDIQLA
jgi:membrane protease YdiL (CAAX protease family)